MSYALNPVDNLAPLALAKVPLLHVCGAADDVVPIEENSLLVKQRYGELGGEMTLISKPHCNHHPHSLRDPTRIVNFVLSHTGFKEHVTQPTTPFGYDYFELRNGLSNCLAKFEKGKTGRVAFLGGSITASDGWRNRVCENLTRRFPDTQFDFVAAGIPSLGSTPGAFRFQRDVLANGPVDLLFEEAAVNDDTNGFSMSSRFTERRVSSDNRLGKSKHGYRIAAFCRSRQAARLRSRRDSSVIVSHERVAEHYQIPSVNLAKEVAERIAAGEFSWEKDFRDLHPAPFGHALYAQAIERLLSAAENATTKDFSQSVLPLPPPLDPASYFHGRLIGPADVIANGQAILGAGWALDDSWKPTDKAGTRAGFVDVPALIAETPGASMKLKFSGIGIGVFVASGPDAGNLEFRIDDQDWETCDLFTQWSPALHLPWAKMLSASLEPGQHELELRIATDADGRSQGHAVRIIHFLVNGDGT
ncbi:MAG: SGNH/GDSL hydrolase family protein [Pirellulaceae bacterium]